MARMTRKLPCPLEDKDILERADRLAHLHTAIAEVESRRAEANKAFKEDADLHAANAKVLAKEIRERTVERDVEVVENRDDRRFVVEWIRQDTLECVESRKMTDDEIVHAKQGKLPLEKAPPKPKLVPPATADGGGPEVAVDEAKAEKKSKPSA